MSSKNQPRQFANGVGVYSPWTELDANVQAAMTKQAPPRKFQWLHGAEAKAHLRRLKAKVALWSFANT